MPPINKYYFKTKQKKPNKNHIEEQLKPAGEHREVMTHDYVSWAAGRRKTFFSKFSAKITLTDNTNVCLRHLAVHGPSSGTREGQEG